MSGLPSWGNYPTTSQRPQALHWRDQVAPALAVAKSTLVYGNGRSYGDSCIAVGEQVLHGRGLDRLITADWQTGLVRAEAGMLLSELLALAIPRGWFLPVTPGTQYVTLGGAVANDVHGKNHHVAGTFGCHVTALGLQRSDRPFMECNGDNNGEMLAATVGGLGLTGVITWVELQLKQISSSAIRQHSQRFGSIDEFFALSDALDHAHEYAVAWVDCRAGGANLGRGIYTVGDHCEQQGPLLVAGPARLQVPVELPVSMVNPVSLALFNACYFRKPLASGVVGYRPFFYPLDGVQQWNRIYGKAGFQQYQCVLPQAEAEPAVTELLRQIVAANKGSFLTVLKRCGGMASPGLLSFPMAGVSLAIDFPNCSGLEALFERMDTIVAACGGRLYPAKDARMPAALFRQGYPQWQTLESLRDPALLSRFWQRVAL